MILESVAKRMSEGRPMTSPVFQVLLTLWAQEGNSSGQTEIAWKKGSQEELVFWSCQL